MGKGSVPRGPSAAQIRQEARLEEERVRFQNEKRQFIERVGAYETLASERLVGERGSFEFADWAPKSTVGIQIPAKFSPTFNFEQELGKGTFNSIESPSNYWEWFNAPNLGVTTNPDTRWERARNKPGMIGMNPGTPTTPGTDPRSPGNPQLAPIPPGSGRGKSRIPNNTSQGTA